MNPIVGTSFIGPVGSITRNLEFRNKFPIINTVIEFFETISYLLRRIFDPQDETTVNKLRQYADIELKKEFVRDPRFLLRHVISSRSSTDTLRIYKLIWIK